MIRDPSDGSVKEKPEPQEPIGRKPDPLFEAIKAALMAGKVKPERVSEKWEYRRAWNDGIDFALRQIADIEKHRTG